MKIEIAGITALETKVERLKKETIPIIEKELLKAGFKVERKAKLTVHVDTGLLKGSIHTEQAEDKKSVTVGTDLEYAPHVEFGTYKDKAQPFLIPAYEKIKSTLARTIEKKRAKELLK